MGGPSGPTLSDPVAKIRPKSVGPEGPPTKAKALREGGLRHRRHDAATQRSRTRRKPTSS
ncbi:DUF6053 domain-containing protein [Lysobacter enzymogenes]|uniref:DUF6053 domain-containing protein n=1 Tax=Lysobacter enzymogenes TaxID=69 RepID=UPI003D18E399